MNDSSPGPDKCDVPTAIRYRVNGFRSLLDFEIDLRPGINVLVGPNGSGKSNFIEFLDFIYTLTASGASTATSAAGGISRVFSQEVLRHKSPRISVHISGVASLHRARPETGLTGYFKFDYKVDVRFHKSRSSIYISSEEVKFGRLNGSAKAARMSNFLGSIALHRYLNDDGIDANWSVGDRLLEDNVRNPLTATESSIARKSISEHLNRVIENYDAQTVEADQSIFREFSVRQVPALRAVRNAISRGRSFNIAPSAVRGLDDISRPPILDKDGTGLSSLLYELQALRSGRPGRGYIYSAANKDTLAELVQWTKLVLPQLNHISVTADVHLGKYMPYLSIGIDAALRVPFSSVSDGTIKWICLVAMLISGVGSHVIEEPENYLHPKMQQFLVELIRETYENDDPLYFIMSTHSESILNQMRPEELILFHFEERVTRARRPDNADNLTSEIRKTGFGLGQYYVSNAIS